MLVNTICDHLSQRIVSGQLTNDEIVQIIEHIGGYLNLQTIAAYAHNHKLSYTV